MMGWPECVCKFNKPCDYCRAIEVAGQRLQELEQEERQAFQASIQRGLDDSRNGRTHPWSKVKQELGV